MKQQKVARRFSFVVLAVTLSFFLTGQSVFAQSTVTTTAESGYNPGRSYSISDIETIGLYSGNMMLNLPVGSLPAGRGGMSAAVNLRYDSKIWETRVLESYDTGVTIQDANNLFQSDEGGWHYGYKYALDLDLRLMGPEDGFCTQGNVLSFYPYKLNLVLPDGSRHGLFADGYMNPELSTGPETSPVIHPAGEFMQIFPDGRPACTTGNPPYSTEPVTGTITYFTDDGTFLRVELETDSDSTWENNKWTLYMPDGSRVIYNPGGGVSQRVIDRNGNSIDVIETASDTNYSNHKTTTLLDDLDRKVVIEYEADDNEDRIHSKGFNGENVVTRVLWKDIIVNRTYARCVYNPVGSGVDNQNFPLNETLRVVHRVYLPEQISQNLFYEFGYNADSTTAADSGWGEINKVTLPSQAWTEYDYYFDNFSGSLAAESVLMNRPVTKRLKYDSVYDGATEQVTDTWTYTPIANFNELENMTGMTVTSPDGGTTTEHYAQGTESAFTPPAQPDYVVGEVYKTVAPDGSLVERFYQSNVPVGSYPVQLNKGNRFVKYEFTSLKDAAGNLTKTAIKEYSRDKNGNVTEIKEYDYVAYSTVPRNSLGRPYALPSGATPARITKTAYYNDTPDASSTTYTDADIYFKSTSPRLLNLVRSAEVQNGSSVAKSRAEMTYDNTSYSSNTKGGNLTETKSWDSYKGGSSQSYSNPLTSTNSISISAVYDDYGNPTQTIDANGIQSTMTYGCIDGQTSCTDDKKNIYPTKTETASNSLVKRTMTAVYDFNTGLVKTATDVDNNVSTATEYDALGRPTKVAAAVGTSSEIWTQTVYDDVNRRVIVKSDLETKGDAKKVGTKFYDQLGRVRLVKTLEDASTQSATNETDGIKVQTRYKTSGSYTYQLVSNPYRIDYLYNATPTNEPEMGWTLSKTINTGRHSETETFSGAGLPTAFGGSNSNSTGKVQTDIDAERTLVTDQAGKQRISKTNALGWLTDVWEITAADSATEAVSFYTTSQLNLNGYKTSYQYDTLNNLTAVNQGSQTRSFSYSSLSRLLSATNPEMGTTPTNGTIYYVYDNNGNLTSKTDARSITTAYTYDALNRVTFRDYSDTTPDVTYTYDNITNAKGKLTKVSSSLSETSYTAFDIMGRVTASQQKTPIDGETISTATVRQMSYVYNLSGALIEETYPSTRVVKNVLDNDGDLSIVQSKKNSNYGFWNYADNFTYTAAGALSSMQLGNGRWESTQFNSRLQPTQIALGTTQNATDKLKLDFEYGTLNTGTGQVINGTNNGNVAKQTIIVPTETRNSTTYDSFSATQYYVYDSLNRIKIASENLTPSGQSAYQSWQQTFTYDRYGNRNFDEANTTTLPKNCGTSPNFTVCTADKKVLNPSISTTNNRLSTNDDYAFDNAGNTTQDAQGRTFIYDAENKQIEVKDSQNNTIGQYFYDGDGKRVKKYVPSTGETTIFIYDASGKLVAEYSTQVASQQDAKVSYLTADHLGSSRINTDANGAVTARHDYQPFGEEIERASYGADAIRKQFATYERDKETDLDFAQARYHNFNLGRFNSPDPILIKKQRLADPQAINLYIYVRNNPLIYLDPNGMEYVSSDGKSKVNYEVIDGKIVHDSKSAPETASLKKLVAAINQSGSATAINQFMALNNNQTKVTVLIGNKQLMGKTNAGYHFVQDENGNELDMDDPDQRKNAAFIGNRDDGTLQYKSATISIDASQLYGEENVSKAQRDFDNPYLTGDDLLAATFAHETVHDTDPNQINAVFDSKKTNGVLDESVFHPTTPRDADGGYPKGSPYRVGNDVRNEVRYSRQRQENYNILYNSGGCLTPNF